VNRDKSQNPFRLLGQAGGVNSSEIKPDGPLVGRLTFVKDFTQEHCFHGLHLASIEISGIFKPWRHLSYGWPARTLEERRYELLNL
jgi:hypothetical protein